MAEHGPPNQNRPYAVSSGKLGGLRPRSSLNLFSQTKGSH